MKRPAIALPALSLVLCPLLLTAAETDAERYAERYSGKRLYTEPDPSAGGGITATVVRPQQPITAVFALPPDNPGRCYQGTLADEGRRFEFRGLPVDRYDLFVVYDDAVYEGLTLHRGDDTLRADDRRLIETIIEESEPFFDKKRVHRMAGETGALEGKARALATFLITRTSYDTVGGVYQDHRRAFKVVLLEQVGPGWQIARTREIYTAFVKPSRDFIGFHYRRALQRIRVVDTVKDLGALDLRTAER